MQMITIYQGASGSGQGLAEAVAGKLGYRCVGRTELVEAGRQYGISEAKLNDIMEKSPRWWECLLQNMRPYRVALLAAFCEIAAEEKVVYHGHLGHELLSSLPQVLKVLLTAPIEMRIQQVASREHLSDEQAREYIEAIDKARSRRLKSMFGTDWRDPSRYDLVLNLGRMNLKSATQTIVEASKLEEYQPTASSESEFLDLSLKARVHASLVASKEFPGALFEIHADNGHVHVSGTLQFWISEERVVQAVKKVPGVNGVTTDLASIPLEENVAS